VREAIQRLAWEGLLDVRPRSGIVIAPLRPDDWLRVLDARRGVEVVLARSAARFVTREAADLFHEAALAMQKAVISGNVLAFIQADKPVLGICRGCQLLNVYFGGTLIQDIPTQWPGAILHNDTQRYERLIHEVHFMPGSRLSDIYGYEPRRVTSIHHQCVDRLGNGLVLEARSPIDLVPEGIRHTGHRFVMGVQWHPEFHGLGFDAADTVLDSGPLMMDFLKVALRRAGNVRRLARGVARVRDRIR
jgi:anthranilate/para-aminobenzoate synthase component II